MSDPRWRVGLTPPADSHPWTALGYQDHRRAWRGLVTVRRAQRHRVFLLDDIFRHRQVGVHQPLPPHDGQWRWKRLVDTNLSMPAPLAVVGRERELLPVPEGVEEDV